MNLIRRKVNHLIASLSLEMDLLPDEDLESTHAGLIPLYYDLYMLRAIQEAKNNLNPGDTLTREEAIQFLLFL